jgi:hypothetical protein
MLYPLSYEGQPATSPCPKATVLALRVPGRIAAGVRASASSTCRGGVMSRPCQHLLRVDQNQPPSMGIVRPVM